MNGTKMTTQRITRVAVLPAAVKEVNPLNRIRRRTICTMAAAMVFVSFHCSQGKAALLYSAEAFTRIPGGFLGRDQEFVSSATSPVEASAGAGYFYSRGDAFASAGQGSLSAFSSQRASSIASARASFEIDDLVFSSSLPFNLSVNTQLNLHLSGQFAFFLTGGMFGESADVLVSLTLPGEVNPGDFNVSGRVAGSRTEAGLAPIIKRDLLETIESTTLVGNFGEILVNFNDTVTTPSFNVPVNQPLPLRVSLTTTAGRFPPFNTGSSVSVFFADTLSFPTSEPVFNLPDGFTVNSAQAQIVNNRWVGGAASSPVPEPSSFCIFGFGCLALLRYGWRRDCRKGIRKAPA